jgi:cell division protein FtsX
VFLRRGVSPADVDRVAGVLQQVDGVERVYFVDRRAAYEDLRQSFRGLDRFGLPHHAFPAWLLVDVADARVARWISTIFSEDAAVAEVDAVPRLEQRLLCNLQEGK